MKRKSWRSPFYKDIVPMGQKWWPSPFYKDTIPMGRELG